MSDALAVIPVDGPLDVTLTVPGSKSITNRALLCAALASGVSRIEKPLVADDTEAMIDSLQRLGVDLVVDEEHAAIEIVGGDGFVPPGPVGLDARLSGTTARFLLPVLACGTGKYLLDAALPMRRRPMGPILAALFELGAQLTEEGEPDHLPLSIEGRPLRGGRVALRGDVSSQFVSGLMMAAPLMTAGLRISLTTDPVSRPYLALTAGVMAAFGVEADLESEGLIVVPPAMYTAVAPYVVEPDASTASYFFAAAAICGGRVRIDGLGRGSAQGDLAFVDVLARMGAEVELAADHVEVRHHGELQGIDVDMSEISDTAQTLAAVAVFASSPTRVRGISFVRGKETDRIAAVVAELRRCGIDAVEERDGFTVVPGVVQPTTVHTYGDHRMAMSFALIGLRIGGIEIEDPGCVAKTFPEYWTALDGLRTGHR
jgi:3-phosphoshikimate 1-carboxyvinyltransferase